MQDKELYQTILGLSTPWQVENVELDVIQGEIRVSVEHPRSVKFGCPECACSLPCFDHGEERRWRHLNSCQFKTIRCTPGWVLLGPSIVLLGPSIHACRPILFLLDF